MSDDFHNQECLMELRQMEYLVTLADERHFTRAAQLIGVSQSGLSAGIRGLEQELGASLFTRTTRRVEPTDAALALLPHARAMLDQERAARAVVHATRQVSGTLRIGTEQCLGVIDATALIDRFHRRHPQVEIQFRQAGSHELIDSLRADALDVAFVAAAAHLGTLPHQALGDEDLVLVCPADHALADVAVASWEALAVEDHVDFDPTWGVRPLTDAAFEARGLSRRVRFQVSDVHTLLDFVDRGLGVAIVPRHVSNKPQASRLVTVALPPDAPRWEVSVVQSRRAGADSAAPHLLELVADAPACRS
jgi:DNA-binding transcriptional LysR family regulator